jgi:ABC-type Zn2+ transport system substrate-binding protein/surface adhesin
LFPYEQHPDDDEDDDEHEDEEDEDEEQDEEDDEDEHEEESEEEDEQLFLWCLLRLLFPRSFSWCFFLNDSLSEQDFNRSLANLFFTHSLLESLFLCFFSW